MTTLLARDLTVDQSYKLKNTLHIKYITTDYEQRLLARPHILLEKVPSVLDNSLKLVFKTDGIGEFAVMNPLFYVYENQEFIHINIPGTSSSAPVARKGGKRKNNRRKSRKTRKTRKANIKRQRKY